MKRSKWLIGLFISLLLALSLALPAAANGELSPPSITPSEVDEVIWPGTSIEIEKIVQTPVIAPKPDILFLADTTGSMGGVIENVSDNAVAIMNAILTAAPDAQFGVANYKDYQYPTQVDPYVTQWQRAMTSDTTLVETAINSWSAGGGYDGSEGWFASLDRAANPPPPGNPGWRADSTRIIVLIGDAPAHDPVPQVLTGVGYDVTEATVTTDLQAEGIKLIAVSISTNPFYTNGLDDDPLLDNYDYPAAPSQGGTPGQASRIATATGGLYLFAPTAEEVAGFILEGLTSLPVTVSMTSDCSGYITTSFDPESQVVTSGDVATFTETISVAADTPGGTYECLDWVLVNGEQMVDEAGAIIYETKTIRVPDCWVTGGGQIVTTGEGKKKDQLRVSFAGNVGRLNDGSPIGQWNMNLHNVDAGYPVDVNWLDKAHFHTTSILSLEFYDARDSADPGVPILPDPPPAGVNLAFFIAEGKLSGEEGWKLHFAAMDAGEPGVDDRIAFSLWNPGGEMVYYQAYDGFPSSWVMFVPVVGTYVTTRAAGNLQIHAEMMD